MRVCTAVPRYRLGEARALAQSYARHHPGQRLIALVTDAAVPGHPDTDLVALDARHDDPDVEWMSYRQLDAAPLYEALAVSYEADSLPLVAAPLLISQLLARGATSALYLEASSAVRARLDPVRIDAERHGLLLWPRRSAPLADPNDAPDDHALLVRGPFDWGLVGVSAGAMAFLAWWTARLTTMRSPHEWLAEALPLFPHRIVRPAPLSPWQPDSRSPVVRFEGIDPARPWMADATFACAPLTPLHRFAELASHWRNRAALLESAPEPDRVPWLYFDDGTPIPERVKQTWAQLRTDWVQHQGRPIGPPLTDRHALAAWMADVDPDEPTQLPRLLAAVYRERLDLRDFFAGVGHDPEVRRRLLVWGHHLGGVAGVPAEFLPPAPELDSIQPAPIADDHPRARGVLIAGFLAAEIGLGAAARQLVRGCELAGVLTATFTYRHLNGDQLVPWVERGDGRSICDTVILAVNWPEAGRLATVLGPRFAGATRRIGLWFWELDTPAPGMAESIDQFDEIWVTNPQTAAAVRASRPDADVSIHVLPLGVDLGLASPDRVAGTGGRAALAVRPHDLLRQDLGLPEGFVYLTGFDFASVMARKNPLGAVRAFTRAFPNPMGTGPTLLVKTLNATRFRADDQELRWRCGPRSDIIMMDGSWSEERTHQLIQLCDAVISMHRAEGYGLWLLEALALGKPVIATDHPGNRVFMTNQNSWLVPARTVPVPPDVPLYGISGHWAEPDESAAAELIREVYDGRGLPSVVDRGNRARTEMAALADGSALAQFVLDRLAV